MTPPRLPPRQREPGMLATEIRAAADIARVRRVAEIALRAGQPELASWLSRFAIMLRSDLPPAPRVGGGTLSDPVSAPAGPGPDDEPGADATSAQGSA